MMCHSSHGEDNIYGIQSNVAQGFLAVPCLCFAQVQRKPRKLSRARTFPGFSLAAWCLAEGWLGFGMNSPSDSRCWVSRVFDSLALALIQAANVITKKELLVTDPDTDDKQLIYEITTAPRNGYVENKLKPGAAVTTFTQGMELGLCVFSLLLQLLQFVK